MIIGSSRFISNTLQIAFLAVPLCVAGCNSGANTPAPTTVADAPTEVPVASTAPTTKPVADVKVTGGVKPAGKGAGVKVTGAPKPTYKVVQEALPGAPAELSAALKRVQVPPPPADFKIGDAPRVKLTTSKGAVVVQLDAKGAPLHARSFAYLAKRGFFDGTTFHRFADLTGQGGNIIQGGDPLSKDAKTRAYAGVGGPGYQIPREHNSLTHEKLVIAAARSQNPDSAGSQFYITQAPVPFLDEGDGYTVFGKVVSGGDVAVKLRQDDILKKAELVK